MDAAPFQIACDEEDTRTMTVENASRDAGYFSYHYWLVDEYLILVTEQSVPGVKDKHEGANLNCRYQRLHPKSLTEGSA
jgi:hypothetical protein